MAQLVQLPDVVDISFVAGDTFRIRVRVIDPNTGLPITINPDPATSGEAGEYTFCAEIAKDDPLRPIVAQFDITPDNDPDNPDADTTGVILTLSPTETAALPGMGSGTEFHGLWDLEVRFPNGDIRTVAKGAVLCVLDVSHCPPGMPGP